MNIHYGHDDDDDEDEADQAPPAYPSTGSSRAPSPRGRVEYMSPHRPNMEPRVADTQQDYPYSSTSANVERHALGYASIAALRERVADTMLTGVYRAPNAKGSTATTTETLYTQTEDLPTRDIGVGVNDNLIEGERIHELKLGLCAPHDLPLMAVAQLLEAERRLSDLLNRLEAEIVRAEAQEERKRLRDSQDEDEANQAHGTYGRFESTDQWTKRFATSIDKRLRRRHGDIEGVTPAVFWHRSKADRVASPPRKRMDHKSPERQRVAMFASISFPQPFADFQTAGGAAAAVSAPPPASAAPTASGRRTSSPAVGVRPSRAL
jgi:hypothetical protein